MSASARPTRKERAPASRPTREVFEPLITAHNGRLVKTMGDALLVEFRSVVDALRCAVEVQRLKAERNVGVQEPRRLIYRIGINLGDVILEGDDIHGDGVNIAERLQELADPGGIAVSGTAYDQFGPRSRSATPIWASSGSSTSPNRYGFIACCSTRLLPAKPSSRRQTMALAGGGSGARRNVAAGGCGVADFRKVGACHSIGRKHGLCAAGEALGGGVAIRKYGR